MGFVFNLIEQLPLWGKIVLLLLLGVLGSWVLVGGIRNDRRDAKDKRFFGRM